MNEYPDIRRLIPQREPILMVESMVSYSPEGARTEFRIDENNIFLRDGVFSAPGIIEHVAQSAAAWAGYPTYARGHEPAPGYIGEIKDFSILGLPVKGALLETSLHVLGEAGGTVLMQARVTSGEEPVAEGRVKVFIGER